MFLKFSHFDLALAVGGDKEASEETPEELPEGFGIIEFVGGLSPCVGCFPFQRGAISDFFDEVS